VFRYAGTPRSQDFCLCKRFAVLNSSKPCFYCVICGEGVWCGMCDSLPFPLVFVHGTLHEICIVFCILK